MIGPSVSELPKPPRSLNDPNGFAFRFSFRHRPNPQLTEPYNRLLQPNCTCTLQRVRIGAAAAYPDSIFFPSPITPAPFNMLVSA